MANPTEDGITRNLTLMQRIRLSAQRAKAKAKHQRIQEQKVKAYKNNIKKIEKHQRKSNYVLSIDQTKGRNELEDIVDDDDWTCIVIHKTPNTTKKKPEPTPSISFDNYPSFKRRNSSPIQSLFNQITEQIQVKVPCNTTIDNESKHNENTDKDNNSHYNEKRFRPFLSTSNAPDIVDTVDVIMDIDENAIQIELQNYINYQSEQKTLKIKENNLCLIHFHEIKPQIILNWKSMKSQHFDNLIEKLLEYMSGDDEDIANNIGYNVVERCYGFMRKQYNDHCTSKSMVFHLIYLNLSLFYRLKKSNKLQKMLENVYKCLDWIIETIFGSVCEIDEVLKRDNDDLKRYIDRFIVECCMIIWSILHYGFAIDPNTMELKQEKDNYNKDNCNAVRFKRALSQPPSILSTYT